MKRKFLNLEPRQQHKRCASLLRSLYVAFTPDILAEYNTVLRWMQIDPVDLSTPKAIAERYHWHLQTGGLRVKEHLLLPLRTGDRVPKLPFGPIAIYLDHVRSAYNVGSILRTCEALRLGTIHFSPNTPTIEDEKVARTALGADKIVPTVANASLDSLPRPFIALDTSDHAIALNDFIFPSKFTLILGNEELGISPETLAQADDLIEIPMYGAKNSLNVACAFAIAGAEIRRQIFSAPR